MKYRKHRGSGGIPPFLDPAFAEALAGEMDRDKPSRRNPKHDHKAMQLCRQVQRALGLALAGECGDDLLRELYVMDVTPAPDAGHLLVRVVVPAEVDLADALGRLERAGPRLRASVARAITRKRAPELSFVPLAGEEMR